MLATQALISAFPAKKYQAQLSNSGQSCIQILQVDVALKAGLFVEPSGSRVAFRLVVYTGRPKTDKQIIVN